MNKTGSALKTQFSRTITTPQPLLPTLSAVPHQQRFIAAPIQPFLPRDLLGDLREQLRFLHTNQHLRPPDVSAALREATRVQQSWLDARSTLQALIGPQTSLDEALTSLRQIALSNAATLHSSVLISTGVLPNRNALLRELRSHTLPAYQAARVALQARAPADLLDTYRPATVVAAPVPAIPPGDTAPAWQPTILDAARHAAEDLPGRIRTLLNVEGGSGLLKAEFLVSQLLTILVLVLTLSIDEADGAEEAAILQQLASEQTVMFQLVADIRREQLRQRQSLYVVGGRPVNLRAAPRPRAGVVMALYPGVQLRRLAARGPWAQVETLDLVTGEVRVGWCLKKYLRRARFPRP